MNSYRRSLTFFILAIILLQLTVIIVAGLNRPAWGDEGHFVETVNLFGRNLNLNTLTHYNEMSGPLPFVIYSFWGRLFGFELSSLRILSVLIALICYLLFHRLIFIITGEGKVAFWMALFLSVHPYMVGFSIFVFTDGLAILFLIAAALAIVRTNPLLLGLSCAAALLCRHYAVFLIAATVVYSLIIWLKEKRKDSAKMLWAGFASILPLVFLIVLWGGLSPDNTLRNLYLEKSLIFHPNYLILYICLLFAYQLPIVVLKWRKIYNDWKTLLICFVVSWLYWFAPVGPSKYDIANNTFTVGLFNRLIVWIYDAKWLEQGIFFVCFMLGLPILAIVLKGIRGSIKQAHFDFVFFLDLSILLFLMTMPFSYLGWEKYIMPLVPFVSMRLWLTKDHILS
ncbi:MAG: hypothetical protein DRP47_09810 [Candidatus Zixiibacteriota bacterium]|nr:MAG: hypothetical protein DRP47_09810 [candidate division Zixibacteria bacterium]